MTLPKRTSPRHPSETTVAQPPSASLGGEGDCHLEVARNAAAAAQADEAVRDLLRRRLRSAFLVVTGTFALVGCLGLANVALHGGPVQPVAWRNLTFAAGITAVLAALTVLVWGSGSLSLAQLRAAELTLVGLFALACCWKQLNYLDATVDLIHRFGDGGTVVLAGYHGAFWFALLAVYGLFVPNSWRRCAVVVALIAACPFAIALAASQRTDWSLAGRPLLFYLIGLGFWSGFGGLLAVFGSRHIAALRRLVQSARQVGPYRLVRRLGAGGMGEVYLAEHELLRRPCAVKLIGSGRLADSRSLQLFEDEARATAALTHPNTVEVYDYGRTEDGTFYYVMEYLPGLSLAELVARHGPVPPGRAVFLLRQVCDALGEAHAAGLVHRDVKPGNVFASRRGGVPDVAKLLDFGLVQTVAGTSTVEAARGLVGTPAYLSPEQAAGGCLDGRSDLYSLGAVAYFLLTGQPPFTGKNIPHVLAAHRSEPARFPGPAQGQLPGDLQAVVLRCLAKDPSDRFAGAESLELALAACSCAGEWTRERAAEWWREQAAADGGSPDQTLRPTARP